MIDKNKFDEAFNKAIDVNSTPNEAAISMQKIMQQTMQGDFGQFSVADMPYVQQAVQKAQMQFVQKA
jgi:hypothetical protein